MYKNSSGDSSPRPPRSPLSTSAPHLSPFPSGGHADDSGINYPISRTRSEYFGSQQALLPSCLIYDLDQGSSNVAQRLAALERLVAEMRFRMEEMEEDTGSRKSWGVRYSRRMAILANILIGFWRFWEVFMELFQQRRRVLMQSLLSRKNDKLNENISVLFEHTYKSGTRRSFAYFICALLLYSKHPWKRTIGLFFSSLVSLYLVYVEPHNMQIVNYFTLFANLLYGTASWSLAGQRSRTKPLMPPASNPGAFEKLKVMIREAIEHF